MPDHPQPPSSGSPGYETRDVHIGRIAWSGVFLVLTIVGSIWLARAVFDALYAGERRQARPVNPLAVDHPLPPAPRLEVVPQALLKNLRQYEDRLLHRYDWIDEPAGRARIPIERAMDYIAAGAAPPAGEAAP
jgi:hypothetical protein